MPLAKEAIYDSLRKPQASSEMQQGIAPCIWKLLMGATLCMAVFLFSAARLFRVRVEKTAPPEPQQMDPASGR